jgi:hypothetical protein
MQELEICNQCRLLSAMNESNQDRRIHQLIDWLKVIIAVLLLLGVFFAIICFIEFCDEKFNKQIIENINYFWTFFWGPSSPAMRFLISCAMVIVVLIAVSLLLQQNE